MATSRGRKPVKDARRLRRATKTGHRIRVGHDERHPLLPALEAHDAPWQRVMRAAWCDPDRNAKILRALLIEHGADDSLLEGADVLSDDRDFGWVVESERLALYEAVTRDARGGLAWAPPPSVLMVKRHLHWFAAATRGASLTSIARRANVGRATVRTALRRIAALARVACPV